MFASFFTQGNQCPPRQSWEGESTKTTTKHHKQPYKMNWLVALRDGKAISIPATTRCTISARLELHEQWRPVSQGSSAHSLLRASADDPWMWHLTVTSSRWAAMAEFKRKEKERNYHFFNIFHFKLQGAFFRREAPWTLTSLRSRWVSWGYAACEIQSLSLSPGWRSQNTHSLDTGG